MTQIVCPECGKDDMVHKVSAIYDGGFVTVQNNSPLVPYGVVDRTITTVTPLAQKLALPSKPQPPETGCSVWVALIVGAAVGGAMGTFLDSILDSIMGVSSFNGSTTFTILLTIGIPVVLLILLDKNIKSKHKDYQEKLYQWDKVRQKWSELYYCSRNDCVFNPDTGKSVPPERMSTLIY